MQELDDLARQAGAKKANDMGSARDSAEQIREWVSAFVWCARFALRVGFAPLSYRLKTNLLFYAVLARLPKFIQINFSSAANIKISC